MIGGLVRCGGLVTVALVLTFIILKLRKETAMEHNKNRTVISDIRNAGTETIWAIGTSISATAVHIR